MTPTDLLARLSGGENLHSEFKHLYYDETPILRATFNDLSRDAFDQFLLEAHGRTLEEWGIPFETLLRNLNAGRADQPTLAGLLFFGRQPQQFLPNAMLTAARIPGLDLTVAPVDQKRLEGRITVMFDEADFCGFEGVAPETPGIARRCFT